MGNYKPYSWYILLFHNMFMITQSIQSWLAWDYKIVKVTYKYMLKQVFSVGILNISFNYFPKYLLIGRY